MSAFAGTVLNVQRSRCGLLEWDTPEGSSEEGLGYKIRFFSGRTYVSTPSSERTVLSSSTNSLAFTAVDLPTVRPLNATVSFYQRLLLNHTFCGCCIPGSIHGP